MSNAAILAAQKHLSTALTNVDRLFDPSYPNTFGSSGMNSELTRDIARMSADFRRVLYSSPNILEPALYTRLESAFEACEASESGVSDDSRLEFLTYARHEIDGMSDEQLVRAVQSIGHFAHIVNATEERYRAAANRNLGSQQVHELVQELRGAGVPLHALLEFVGSERFIATMTSHPNQGRTLGIVNNQDQLRDAFDRSAAPHPKDIERIISNFLLRPLVRETPPPVNEEIDFYLSQLRPVGLAFGEIALSWKLAIEDSYKTCLSYSEFSPFALNTWSCAFDVDGHNLIGAENIHHSISKLRKAACEQLIRPLKKLGITSAKEGKHNHRPLVQALKDVPAADVATLHSSTEFIDLQKSLERDKDWVAKAKTMADSKRPTLRRLRELEEKTDNPALQKLAAIKLKVTTVSRAGICEAQYNQENLLDDLGILECYLMRHEAVCKDGNAKKILNSREFAALYAAAQTFGFHFLGGEARNNSDDHARIVNEILERIDPRTSYKTLTEEQEDAKVVLLKKALLLERSVVWDGNSPADNQGLSVSSHRRLGWMRAVADAKGENPSHVASYIISMFRSKSDVLELALLLKEVGLVSVVPQAEGEPKITSAIPIVPLFETPGDLAAAKESILELLADPCTRNLVLQNGKLRVMVGYSDGSKEAGTPAARILIQDFLSFLAHLEFPGLNEVEVEFGTGSTNQRGRMSGEELAAILPAGKTKMVVIKTIQGEEITSTLRHKSTAQGWFGKTLVGLAKVHFHDELITQDAAQYIGAAYNDLNAPIWQKHRELLQTATDLCMTFYQNLYNQHFVFAKEVLLDTTAVKNFPGGSRSPVRTLQVTASSLERKSDAAPTVMNERAIAFNVQNRLFEIHMAAVSASHLLELLCKSENKEFRDLFCASGFGKAIMAAVQQDAFLSRSALFEQQISSTEVRLSDMERAGNDIKAEQEGLAHAKRFLAKFGEDLTAIQHSLKQLHALLSPFDTSNEVSSGFSRPIEDSIAPRHSYSALSALCVFSAMDRLLRARKTAGVDPQRIELLTSLVHKSMAASAAWRTWFA